MKLARTFHLTPIAKPRMTRRDRWAKRPIVQKYWEYKDTLLLLSGEWLPPKSHYWLVFYLPMPKSWTKKRKSGLAGRPHRQTPDKDNLEKGFLDVFGEDKEVWSGGVTKLWATQGRIEVYEDVNPLEWEW